MTAGRRRGGACWDQRTSSRPRTLVRILRSPGPNANPNANEAPTWVRSKASAAPSTTPKAARLCSPLPIHV